METSFSQSFNTSCSLRKTPYNLLHPQQKSLNFPEEEKIILIVSGDFGSGKTSFISGLLAAVGLSDAEKSVIINDLATSGSSSIDILRYENFNNINREGIEACSCCDAQSELVQKVAESDSRFIVLETGGLSNGGQAKSALLQYYTHHFQSTDSKPPKILHVTLIDAEQFPWKKESGATTVLDLNAQTADTIIVTKGNEENLDPVIQYLNNLLPESNSTELFSSNEPYLIEEELWNTGIIENETPTIKTGNLSDLEQTRQYLLQNTEAVKIQLYDSLVDNIEILAEQNIIDLISGGDKALNLIKSAFTSYFDRLVKDLNYIQENEKLLESLIHRILRIKGELPFNSEQGRAQYGIDIFLDRDTAGKLSPKINITKRATVTTEIPQIAFYTFTKEPYPAWFSSLGIPVEYTQGVSQEINNKYTEILEQQLENLKAGLNLKTRAEVDSVFELLEKTFLDFIDKAKDKESPYKNTIYSKGERKNAEEVIFDSFVNNLHSYLEYRIQILEELEESGKKQPKMLAAFGFDLIIASELHKGCLLKPEFLKNFPKLESTWQRAWKLNFATNAVLEGLIDSESIRIRGNDELNNDYIRYIGYAMAYIRHENRALSDEKYEEIRKKALKTIQNLVYKGSVKNIPGWDQEELRARLYNFAARNLARS